MYIIHLYSQLNNKFSSIIDKMIGGVCPSQQSVFEMHEQIKKYTGADIISRYF